MLFWCFWLMSDVSYSTDCLSTQTVRDIWAQKDLGTFSGGSFSAEVPPTGAVFVKLSALAADVSH